MRTWALWLGLAITTAACSRSPLRLSSAGSTTGAGGEDSTTATATTADVGASSSVNSGGPMCGVETNDFVQIALQVFNGPLVGCWTGAPKPPDGGTTQSILGTVIASDESSITIDSCPPTADCAGQFSTLTVKAKGLLPYVPSGAFVEVRVREKSSSFFCNDTLMVRNLPSWLGTPNPVSSAELMWLAASSSGEAFDDAPYQIEPINLSCSPTTGGGCGQEEGQYFFRVTVAGSPFDVGMGVTTEVGSPPQWVFRNLQSYASGLCDDMPHLDYWMGIPMLD